jgi:hypothetical protein
LIQLERERKEEAKGRQKRRKKGRKEGRQFIFLVVPAAVTIAAKRKQGRLEAEAKDGVRLSNRSAPNNNCALNRLLSGIGIGKHRKTIRAIGTAGSFGWARC